MSSGENKEYDYKTYLRDLNPIKLTEVLPKWKIEERIFSKQFKGKILLSQEKGWVCIPPYNYGTIIQIEKDVSRVTVSNGMDSISIHGVRMVGTKLYPMQSVIDFKSANSELRLWFPHNERKVEVVLETGRRYPNTTKVHIEMTPESRLKISPQTTLEELTNYF